MIGLRKAVKLEGRAAIELEASIPPATTGRYRSDLHEATRCESICVLKEPAICISGQILHGIKKRTIVRRSRRVSEWIRSTLNAATQS